MESWHFRVTDWDEHFENNRSRGLKKLDWMRVPTKLDGDGYTELMEHENGAAHYGAFSAIIKVAARCHPRGTLVRDNGRPHDIHSISRITRIQKAVLEESLPRLLLIEWLEIQTASGLILREIPQEGAVIRHLSAQEEKREEERRREKKREEERAHADDDLFHLDDSPQEDPKPTIPNEDGLDALLLAWNALGRQIAPVVSKCRSGPILKAWARGMACEELREVLLDPPAIMAKIREGTHLHGKGWFRFLWLFSQGQDRIQYNLTKIMEGNYADSTAKRKPRRRSAARYVPGS